MGLQDSAQFLRVTSAILRSKSLPSATELATASGAPRPIVYRILRFFTYHRAIGLDEAGPAVDRRKLLTLAAGLLTDSAVPSVTTKGPAIRILHRKLLDVNVSHAFGFASAANAYGYFEPSGVTHVLVDHRDRKAAVRAAEDSGGRETIQFYVRDFQRMPPPLERDGLPVTDEVHTLLCLMSDPTGGAHAAFMQDNLEKRGIL